MSGEALDALRASLGEALADPSAHFAVAFSGGIDSTVLLGALAQIVPAARIRALHIDHGLHPASGHWARHCQAVGRSLGIEVAAYQVHVPAAGNREAEARRARYRIFTDALRTDEILLLAHHADDQAETLLLRLLQGRLPRGMPQQRALGRGRLVRPLLTVPRSIIERAAAELDLPWIDDSSNASRTFDRNFLRHEIVPRLRERWPDVAARLAEQATRLTAAADRERGALNQALDGLSGTALPVGCLANHGSPAALLRRWLEREGVGGAPAAALRELLVQAARPDGSSIAVQLAPGLEVRAFAGSLHVVSLARVMPAPRGWCLEQPFVFPGGRLTARWAGGGSGPPVDVEVRPRAGGERLRPARRGGTRSVKRLLQEARIPTWRRRGYPLVYFAGDLAVVPGVTVDETVTDRFATGGDPQAGRWLIRIEFDVGR